MQMGKLRFGRSMFDCLSSGSRSSCFCMNFMENEEEFERKQLITSEKSHLLGLKDVVSGNQTLAFHLKPKVTILYIYVCVFFLNPNLIIKFSLYSLISQKKKLLTTFQKSKFKKKSERFVI